MVSCWELFSSDPILQFYHRRINIVLITSESWNWNLWFWMGFFITWEIPKLHSKWDIHVRVCFIRNILTFYQLSEYLWCRLYASNYVTLRSIYQAGGMIMKYLRPRTETEITFLFLKTLFFSALFLIRCLKF